MARRALSIVNWDNFKINENVYLFSVHGRITNSLIQQTFTEAIADKGGERMYKSLIRDSYVLGHRSARVSLEVFKFLQSPTFLVEPESGVLEQKFGLLLIIEYADHVAIYRKNISGARAIFSQITQIDHAIISRCMLEPDSKIEHLTSESMVAQNNVSQTKVSESSDLSGTMPRYQNSKRIPRKIRIDNAGRKSGISTSTSRINSFASGKKFPEALVWVLDTIDRLNQAKKKLPPNDLLDSFAIPVKFEDERDDLKLEHAVMLISQILNDIQDGVISEAINTATNNVVDIPDLIEPFSKLLELTEDSKNNFSSGELKITYGARSISAKVSSFKEVLLKGENLEITLSDYVRSRDLFMYFFDKPEFAYYNRKLFKDNALLGDINSFLSAFEPHTEVVTITTEKGTGYSNKSSSFSKNSLFKFIEGVLAPKDCFLVCDDLSTEWGDMIAISADSQIFYHAKSGDSELSASDLGVVFSQAQKNFGVIVLDRTKIEYRWPKWQSDMKFDTVQTKIHRIRRKPKGLTSKDDITRYIDNSVRNPNTTREVVVVLNYLSKHKLEASLKRIKAGDTFTDRGVTLQILWHVSALLANASEVNAKFKVVCKP